MEPPSDDLAAAEYVLGLTDRATREAAQARMVADPAFAEAVARWERRLGDLALEIAPADVPPALWQRIGARLGWQGERRPPSGSWQSIAFWRWAAGIAAVIAVIAVGVNLLPRPAAKGVPQLQASLAVTTLERDSGAPAWLATVDAQRGTVQMVPVPSAPDAQGRAAELWVIPPGGAPRSLGAVSVGRAQSVTVAPALRMYLTPDAVLAVTLEPPAGIPHAAPSGPIIAKGMIRL
jgi:anti-sigma-K factor RskA